MARVWSAVGAIAVLALTPLSARQDPAREAADRMDRKLAAITERGNLPPDRLGTPIRTVLSDAEINAYFRYNGRSRLPAGLVDPQITIEDQRHLSLRAMVDLSAVKKEGMLALLPVNGTLEVRAAGALDAANGRGMLQIDSTSVGGIPVAQSLLQTLVTHFSKTGDSPAAFQIDKPFDLPSNIREIRLQRGSATIIQ